MRFGLLASATLTLGALAFVPSTAKADDYHRDHDRVVVVVHDEWRHEHWYHDGDYVDDISMRDLPGKVQDRVNDYRHGRSIDYVQLVHHDHDTFYRFRINDHREGDFYLHIAPSGHLIERVDVGR